VRDDVSPAERRAFVAECRRVSVHRFDTVHSASYDQHWGAVSPSHAAFVTKLTALIPPGGEVLDAACGTGKYWPTLLAAGLHVTGVDQSAGMLDQARRKHPDVPARVLALQDLSAAAGLAGRFDGLLCVDALEYVAPEDWQAVAAGLASVLKAGAPAYVTVEVPGGPLPPPADPRQVPGEWFEGAGYHYYPPLERARSWLAGTGFTIEDERMGDDYWHCQLART
jgi:SAM-dependent methyltransferase